MEHGDLTGATLDGRYRVIEPVAEGAMGVVYRAERLKLGRIVAIKVLHDVLPDELSGRKRFEIEAMAMAKLEHPHCASVLDVGVHNARPFVVMEFVSGQNLKELISAGPVPIPRAAELVRQVLSGLAHAHEHGVIHRDIKPANLVLSHKTGLGDHVKILDFGLARLHDTGQNLTSGIAVGTPAYMAPEQIRGQPIDQRADLYACGVLLFELLTAHKPFHSEKDDPIEVCKMHLSDPIPRLDSKLPSIAFGELEVVVAKALAKRSGKRFSSAQEFSAALAAAVGPISRRAHQVPPIAQVQVSGRPSPVLEVRTSDVVSSESAHAPVEAAPAVRDRAATPAAGAMRPGARAQARSAGAVVASAPATAPANAEGASHPVMRAASAPGPGAGPVSTFLGIVVPRTPTPGVRGTGTSAAREAATSAVREAGTSAAREAGTSDVRGTGTSAAREAGTSAAREAGTSAAREGARRTATPPAGGTVVSSEHLAERSPSSARRPRRWRRAAAGLGAVLLAGGVTLAIFEIRGGEPAPASAASDAAKRADPGQDVIARANELAAHGDKDAALELISRSRRQFPDSAGLPYTAGRIYFSKFYWNDGLKSFREAIRSDPSYRGDPELIKTVLRGFLMTPSYNDELASFLRDDIGRAVQPMLEETARDHPTAAVRSRAANELRRYR